MAGAVWKYELNQSDLLVSDATVAKALVKKIFRAIPPGRMLVIDPNESMIRKTMIFQSISKFKS